MGIFIADYFFEVGNFTIDNTYLSGFPQQISCKNIYNNFIFLVEDFPTPTKNHFIPLKNCNFNRIYSNNEIISFSKIENSGNCLFGPDKLNIVTLNIVDQSIYEIYYGNLQLYPKLLFGINCHDFMTNQEIIDETIIYAKNSIMLR